MKTGQAISKNYLIFSCKYSSQVYHMLRLSFLFISVLSISSLVIFQLNTLQASPVKESNSQQPEHKTPPPDKATTEQTPKKEKQADVLHDKMTQDQLNQIKRYDCRLPKELISHNYQAKTKENPTPVKTDQKNTTQVEKK